MLVGFIEGVQQAGRGLGRQSQPRGRQPLHKSLENRAPTTHGWPEL